MKKTLSNVGAVLRVIAGVVCCVIDPKGYCLSHYTEKELEAMGINIDRR